MKKVFALAFLMTVVAAIPTLAARPFHSTGNRMRLAIGMLSNLEKER